MTLERAIRFRKTVGCKGCEHIAEGVKHTDACHERFRKLLEVERFAKEAKASKSIPSTPGGVMFAFLRQRIAFRQNRDHHHLLCVASPEAPRIEIMGVPSWIMTSGNLMATS